jgi:hypothetical protein
VRSIMLPLAVVSSVSDHVVSEYTQYHSTLLDLDTYSIMVVTRSVSTYVGITSCVALLPMGLCVHSH